VQGKEFQVLLKGQSCLLLHVLRHVVSADHQTRRALELEGSFKVTPVQCQRDAVAKLLPGIRWLFLLYGAI